MKHFFFTQDDFEKKININDYELSKFKYVMLTSDGLDPIIIKKSNLNDRFFKPLINFLQNPKNDDQTIQRLLSNTIRSAFDIACIDDVSIILHEI